MDKVLKSGLRILLATLAIILLAGGVWAGIHRDSRIYDIDYDLILFIILSVVLLVFYFILIYNTFKPQKWTKRTLIFVLSLILLLLLFIVFDTILWLRSFNAPVDKNGGDIVLIISIILSIYLIMLIRIHKIEDKINKKRLKTIILIISPFMVIGVRLGLTKAGVIPNWFNIEVGCPKTFGVSTCELKKYDRCMEKCGSYNINLSGFSIEGYNNRYHNKFEAGKRRYAPQYFSNYGDEYYSLIKREYYQDWVDEMFYEQKNDISEIEMHIIENHSCKESCGINPRRGMIEKPIIYLYPTEETQVNLTLGTPENLSHTYPKYNSEKGRNVVAQPNGDLKDMETGRKLYALYREGKTYAEDNFNEGFVVKGEDIISFLEEKLALLGLNEREAEEFIVYWLPQMENNKYNLIRFETKAEQDENMPLNITPTPDTVVRVMMEWKAVEEPIDIPEQKLTTPERTGFTVVEWGGSPRS